MSSAEKWENLKITRDEVKNLAAALKDAEFRSLLVDYIKDTQSPEARERYQQEIIKLEAERGVDCAFVNPTPGFVLKTSQNGVKKAFINICSNEKIKRPTSQPRVTAQGRGLNWSIPYTLTPQRHDYDRRQNPCVVYDVVFHPDTLRLANNNMSFKTFVVDTAINGIQDMLKVDLDQRNIKYPKLRYKGTPTPAVIRTTSKQKVELSEEDREFHKKFKFPTPPPVEKKPTVQNSKKRDVGAYTTPQYDIKHRSNIEMDQFTNHKNLRMTADLPKELVITIHLPLLNSTKTVDLNVGDKNLDLLCDRPVKYKLNIRLPYPVDIDGTAKFNLEKRVLEIVLPVSREYHRRYGVVREILGRDDSGVESDPGEYTTHEEERLERVEESFLESDQHYQMPSYEIGRSSQTHVTITLWVKNVDPHSIKMKDTDLGFQIKFISVGSGHFPYHYSFVAKFQKKMSGKVVPDTFENSIILDVPLESASEYDLFWIGANEEEMATKVMFDFPFMRREERDDEVKKAAHEEKVEMPNKNEDVLSPELAKDENSQSDDGEDSEKVPSELPKIPSPKARTCSEGSGDERATSRRSILKNRMSRSLSESCADDGSRNGAGVLYTWSESCISAQDDMDTREKKTVRFNQNIQSQTFRINSSILGQRKKNQKRTKNKRKSLERRMSESENSEESDEREKWIKRREKKLEKETVLKPVISNKAIEGKASGSKKNDSDAIETCVGQKVNLDCKKNAPERENSTENDASCDEEGKSLPPAVKVKATRKKHKKTKKHNDVAFKSQFVNELD